MKSTGGHYPTKLVAHRGSGHDHTQWPSEHERLGVLFSITSKFSTVINLKVIVFQILNILYSDGSITIPLILCKRIGIEHPPPNDNLSILIPKVRNNNCVQQCQINCGNCDLFPPVQQSHTRSSDADITTISTYFEWCCRGSNLFSQLPHTKRRGSYIAIEI